MNNSKIIDLVEDAYTMLKIALKNVEKTHENIFLTAISLKNLPGFNQLLEKNIYDLVSMYEEREGILAPEPIVIIPRGSDNHWLYQKKTKIKHEYFNRYKSYLIEHDSFNEKMANQVEIDSEKILSYCSNPDDIENNKISRKKGLVVGDVQSGKTSSYLGLIATACDYGYKVIVLLSGLTDNLRIQTQKRVDKAFVGARSNTIGHSVEYIGVGQNTKEIYAIPLTNVVSDFGRTTQNVMNFTPSNFSKPIILVVKKNKSVLTALKEWLKPGQNKIDDKILIIDDEADNASLNIRKPNPNNEPSAINGLIRDIYNNFSIATYVGYTATPFANIFINPNDDQSYTDLFPSDFIIQLIAPSNYFGGEKVFSFLDNAIPKPIRLLNQFEENFLPEDHKNSVKISQIPYSLKEAILSFLINNAIRTLRGDINKHRSMLVNITRFNDVQSEIHYQINQYIDEIRRIYEQTHYQADNLFLRNGEMKLLRDIYLKSSFYDEVSKKNSWSDVKKTINSELKMVRVELMNSRFVKENRFDYDQIPNGARVIVVGGFVLSRGLTLEGLCISYFSRAANAYDTMLQMCRWFGYRPNYEDLCRVYITSENLENFRAVLEAVEDLKEQFNEMHLNHKSPDDFGLMIRQSPETLETTMLITARQKMREGKEILKYLNYGGVAVDTSKIFLIDDVLQDNITNTRKFLNKIDAYYVYKNNDNFYENVSNNEISDYLASLKFPIENKRFAKDSLVEYLKDTDIYLNWRVVIASGSGDIFEKLTQRFDYKNTVRRFEIKITEKFVRISGNKNRILDPGIFRTGLDKAELDLVKEITNTRVEKSKEKGIIKSFETTAADYLSLKSILPLLIIYPIQLNKPDEQSEYGDKLNKQLEMDVYDKHRSKLFVGVALGFPLKESKAIIKYVANIRMIEQMYKDDSDEEEN
jgi:hypothetical protein